MVYCHQIRTLSVKNLLEGPPLALKDIGSDSDLLLTCDYYYSFVGIFLLYTQMFQWQTDDLVIKN